MNTHTLRFVLLGGTKTGKTTFFYKLDDRFQNEIIPTIGVDVVTYKYEKNGFTCKNIIWDTSGDERFLCIVNSYLQNNCAFLLFFDLNNPVTFDCLENWIKRINKNNSCKHKHPIFLIGNKKDLPQKVNNEAIGDLVEKYQLIYITTSAKIYDSEVIIEAIINEIYIRYISKNSYCCGIR